MLNPARKFFQNAADSIDGFLDGLTSYRLVLYFLIILLGWGAIIASRGRLPFHWYNLVFSTFFLTVVCRLSAEFFSRILNVARNKESDYITALILALIISPAASWAGYLILFGAGFAAVASKYLLTIHHRHIFNPAGAGAAICGLAFHQYASWWVGTSALMPLVLVGGLVIMRKMHRFWMLACFALVYGLFLHQQSDGAPPLHTVWLTATGTAVLFFTFVMLTEPLTTPARTRNYLIYSALVAVLYGFNKLKISPEEALLIGNMTAFLLEPWRRLVLKLESVRQEAAGLFSFIFSYPGTFKYQAGQYMEWTLPLRQSDSRGNRRYLTMSSAPTERHLAFTIRVPAEPSYFKQMLLKLKPGDQMLASHLAGSFNLPQAPDRKLAFVAGGVGVTPFRSMAKYIIDSRQKWDISLLYCASSNDEFAFGDTFKQAANYGLLTKYLNTATRPIGSKILAQSMPDYKDRLFYVSGPHGFVKSAHQALIELGVNSTNIKSDYFPGYG